MSTAFFLPGKGTSIVFLTNTELQQAIMLYGPWPWKMAYTFGRQQEALVGMKQTLLAAYKS